jgi:hypothetical protein
MYVHEVISRKTFCWFLKVKDEKSRNRSQIRIHWSEEQIHGSGSVPKCQGSTRSLVLKFPYSDQTFQYELHIVQCYIICVLHLCT